MPRKVRKTARIAKVREFVAEELKRRGLKPYTFAVNGEPALDQGDFHRFLKGPPREQTTFNFVADIFQKLGLPLAILDTLNLNEEVRHDSV